MKYVVYYNTEQFGKTLNNKSGKLLKENVHQVLGVGNVIWIPNTHMDEMTTIQVLE